MAENVSECNGRMKCSRMSSAEMDEVRSEISAYEYLCRLEEARNWIQNCIKEQLPTSTELEEVLRNGVILAKLAHFLDYRDVPINKIYDIDQEIYKTKGLQFRHTDNINYWLNAMERLNFPKSIYPDTFDVYDKRNMPKVICCVHALGMYLHTTGRAPEIEDLYGKITFSSEEVAAVQKELDKLGVKMPAFGKIAGMLTSEIPDNSATLHAAIIAINNSLEKKTPNFITLLQNPDAGIEDVNFSLNDIYHEELYLAKAIKMESALNRSLSDSFISDAYDELLTQSEIQHCVDCINKVENVQLVKEAVHDKNVEVLVKALQNPALDIPNVIPGYGKQYFECLNAVRNCEIESNNNSCITLSRDVIKSVIVNCNAEIAETNEKKTSMISFNNAIRAIADSVQKGLEAKTLEVLLNPVAGILCVDRLLGCLYMRTLQNVERLLTRDIIQNCVNVSNQLALEASRTCSVIGDLNMAIDKNSSADVHKCLQNLGMGANLISDCSSLYFDDLVKKRAIKTESVKCDDEAAVSWVSTTAGKDCVYYLNLATLETSWSEPQYFVLNGLYLNLNDIHKVISKVNKKYLKKVFQVQEQYVIRLQAVSRGFLLRTSMPNKLRINAMNKKQNAAIIIQSYFRMWLARKTYLQRKLFFQCNESSVITIQNFWREYRIAKSLKSENPSVEMVSNCVSLLDISDNDYKEEIELDNVRSEVVRTIRYNKDLELKVNSMDLKIGLIIRNHLTAQDLIAQVKKGTKSESVPLKDGMGDTPKMHLSNMLLDHNKESQALLEAYQHLFYLLQTDPKYMARLIYSMSPGRSAMFIDSVIYTLYNYGSTPREECLMLQLFAYALKEEIKTKVEKLSDVSTGTPLVFKMVLDFNKTGCGLSCLKELLQPLVEMILNDDTLHLSTDPVEVYRRWVNEQETSTGLMVQMPYEITIDQAEKIPEVNERINNSIVALEQKVSIFVSRIVESAHLLPYGICYVAKVLKTCLYKKFPRASDLEIMKCVGHLLYYRYIIAAIPAADTFGVVTLQPGKGIQPIQRRNLGAIAKVLHHAAAFQLFEPGSKLSVLNTFLQDCHKTFFDFLNVVCAVEEPEICFNMDAYSEATLLTKPQITLTLQEISISHGLLVKHREDVAPLPNDPLHELLDDLDSPLALDSQYQNDLVTLSLTNKFTVEAEAPALNKLLSTTKQMVVILLQCQSTARTSLLELLRSGSSQEENEQFQSLARKNKNDSFKELLNRFQNVVHFKERILHQLVQLELSGYVTSKDGYQTIINFIAKNIVNRKTYRDHRRLEIEKLNDTLIQLKLKTEYYQETLKYYEEYIQNCLQSLSKNRSNDVKRKVVKYTGLKMMELGILLSIEGLPNNQLKHVLFEISSTDVIGIFSVSVKFLIAPIEKVELDIQNLLKLQYEGETIVEMFGHAKININLLLYLLNKKFF